METVFRSTFSLRNIRNITSTSRQLRKNLGVRNLSLMQMKPYDFVDYMKDNGMRRCFVVYDTKKQEPVTNDDRVLGDLRLFCENEPHDYKQHEGAFLEIGKRSGSLMGAFVRRSNRGQPCGGAKE